MENSSDWVFIENENELFEKLETCSINDNDKSTYLDILCKNISDNDQQQQSSYDNKQNKKRAIKKSQHYQNESNNSYFEQKPGSHYRNPRNKAGKNKVHKGRFRSESPPRKLGNSLRVGCSFCNPKISNRAARRRDIKQQTSLSTWKDYD